MTSEPYSTVKQALEEIRYAPKSLQWLFMCILAIALHSLALGAFIFVFTELFYRLFFGVTVENLFFVRQAGLFLCCLGLFYLAPLVDLKRNRRLVVITILTKVMAVLFLVGESGLVVRPGIILLAAAVDGIMAALLVHFIRKSGLFQAGTYEAGTEWTS